MGGSAENKMRRHLRVGIEILGMLLEGSTVF